MRHDAKRQAQPAHAAAITLCWHACGTSSHLGLWENCFRYVGVGSTGFKSVEEWRAILGAEDEYYDTFKHLNQKVIKPSVNGVNEKSGIVVEPEFRREKRRVSEIRFDVRENPQLSLLDHNEHKRIRETQTFADAREMGLLDVQAIYWIETRGEDYVADAIAYVRKQKDVKSSRSYLTNALNQGYAETSPHDKKQARDAKEKATRLKKAEAERQRIQAEAERVFQEHFEYQKAEGARALVEQPEAAQVAFLGEMARRSNLLSLSGYKERWREVSGDLAKLDSSRRIDRHILGEIHRCAFEQWSDRERHSLASFCADREVPADVCERLRVEGRL